MKCIHQAPYHPHGLVTASLEPADPPPPHPTTTLCLRWVLVVHALSSSQGLCKLFICELFVHYHGNLGLGSASGFSLASLAEQLSLGDKVTLKTGHRLTQTAVERELLQPS